MKKGILFLFFLFPNKGIIATEANVKIHIPIIYATDDNYVMPTIVSMESAVRSMKESSFYEFTILVPDEIKQENINRFEIFKNSYENKCSVNLIKMGNVYSDCFTKIWGEAMYYRLSIPYILKDADKAIYIDGDTLVRHDLQEMYNIDLENNYVGGVPDPAYNRVYFLKKINDKVEKYICSGVLLINCKAWRNNINFDRDILNLCKNVNSIKLMFPDQDIINVVCGGRIKKLPFKFMRFNMWCNIENEYDKNKYAKKFYSKEEFLEGKNNPVIMHFFFPKPWVSKGSPDFLYQEWYNLFNSIKRKYKFKELKLKMILIAIIKEVYKTIILAIKFYKILVLKFIFIVLFLLLLIFFTLKFINKRKHKIILLAFCSLCFLLLSFYIYSVIYRYTYRSTNRIIEIIKSKKHIENPKISVIIPVYNVEKYLRECLNSVINQTMEDIEIICVNDGSTDRSLDILKEYAAKDDRIIVINQTNGFVESARNNGLKIAGGEYIQFVDSDDYLELNACETAYKYALQYDADVVIFGYKNFPEQVGNIKNKRGKGLKYKEVGVFYGGLRSGRHLCRNMIWNKLYRHKIIKGCYFPEWIRGGGDEHFNFQVDKKINTLVQIPKQLYNYRLNLNSIVTTGTWLKKVVNAFHISVDLIEHNEWRFAKHYIAAFLRSCLWAFNGQ